MKNAEQRRSLMKDENDSSGDEDERLSGGSRTNSLFLMGVAEGVAGPDTLLRRAGSTGSLHRRSRTARTERYLHRKSRDEESIVPTPGHDDTHMSSASPYVHTSAHRSLSADHTHNNKVISATPPAPPGDLVGGRHLPHHHVVQHLVTDTRSPRCWSSKSW